MHEHHYTTRLVWTGNTGDGTKDYRSYQRNHVISIAGKPDIRGSSDPSFRGDATRYNPEELLLASLSACHMLWVLHLCAVAGIIVVEYTDAASGTLQETSDGGGRFTEATLHPIVTITDDSRINEMNDLHHRANKLCFIANSCNFPVRHEPVCEVI